MELFSLCGSNPTGGGKHVVLQASFNSESMTNERRWSLCVYNTLSQNDTQGTFASSKRTPARPPQEHPLLMLYSGTHTVERIFNCRLCRARRFVENVFVILASVFRVFRTQMLIQP
ncbi:hypothetical protein HUJ04_001423 [Dendroctonus ponderosae]|nr:hypothetical protein HUJ04_001423 [Dendroctonus ponderosae]